LDFRTREVHAVDSLGLCERFNLIGYASVLGRPGLLGIRVHPRPG
jgi:hypothetical protein